LHEIGAVFVEGHGLGFGESREHDAAELARIPLAIGIERPARFPTVDAHRERARLRDRRLDGGNLGMGLRGQHVDASGLELRQRVGHRLLGAR